MKLLTTILSLCIITAVSFAQYTPMTIKEIQQVPFDSLKKADSLGITSNANWKLQTSPHMGETVEVTALVVVPPGIITYTGRGRTMIVCDTGAAMNDPWSHMFVRYGGTSSATADAEFDNDGYRSIEAGDIITFVGKVDEFPSAQMNSLTQLAPVPGMAVNIISSGNPLPNFTPLEVTDFKTGIAQGGIVNIVTGESYESKGVVLTNLTVTSILNAARGTFVMTDSKGNSISTYDYSYHFTLDTTSTDRVGNPHDLTYKLPALGTKVDTIKGYIATSSGQESPQGYRICPMYPGDVVYGGILPQVTTHRRFPLVVSKDTIPEVNVKAFKQTGSYDIQSVHLYYKVDNGNWTDIPMTADQPNVDSLYKATIPAQPVGSMVSYFIKAIDVNSQENILANAGARTATDTTKGFFFYKVLDRTLKPVLSIRDVQYTPYANGNSPYWGAVDSIGGIVTADTSSITMFAPTYGGTYGWYMQSTTQPWSGIWMVGVDTIMKPLQLGDSVVITGTISEFNDVTEIYPVTSARVISRGNPVPEPVLLRTGDFSGPSGDPKAEPYEGMLVKFNNLTVGNTNPTFVDATEYEVSDDVLAILVRGRDGRNTYSNVVADTSFGYTILRTGNKIGSMTGLIYYANNRYKLVPRTNADFSNVTGVSVAYKNTAPKQYSLMQNYPNPFNPSTTIRYELPVSGFTTLTVYNILGQEVAQLVNEIQNTGAYNVTFDASNLSSGMYLYKLTVGDFVQVKKMMLLK
ncbi:MAG: T9SS type A sorting domain-containing protein [Bacteroidetes bacterium]|nr:T9SS type A sorting domain-containing protein [Bacteroidota bacterium]